MGAAADPFHTGPWADMMWASWPLLRRDEGSLSRDQRSSRAEPCITFRQTSRKVERNLFLTQREPEEMLCLRCSHVLHSTLWGFQPKALDAKSLGEIRARICQDLIRRHEPQCLLALNHSLLYTLMQADETLGSHLLSASVQKGHFFCRLLHSVDGFGWWQLALHLWQRGC